MNLSKKKHLKKTIAVLATVSLCVGQASHPFLVLAQDSQSVSTSVTVGNSGPSFNVTPAETVASTGTSPTNVGTAITFTAKAIDGNGDQYYLAICKGAGITPGNNAPPTCTAGNWCISSATNSNSTATCSYTTLQGDAEENVWYAYACDKNSSSTCSAASQGSGDTGSPFYVNHPPIFDAITNNVGPGGTNPGNTVTWSTNASTKDNDTNTVPDTVTLVVCKTAGVTGTDCDGGASDRWCRVTGQVSNPSCSYNIPNPTADQVYAAYVYLFDSHGMAATGANQGANSSYTVNNVAPVVSSVTLNNGSPIVLNEGSTAPIILTATVTDINGCTDISTVKAGLYRSGVGYSGCDTVGESDANFCYAALTCSATTSCTGSDNQATFQCTAYVQYHADPTDDGTKYPLENWLTTFAATDNDAATDTDEVASGVELNSLIAFDVGSAIAYGNLSVGQTNSMVDTTTVVTATGNVGLDEELSGTNMCTDYPGCSGNTIAVANQKYALSSSTGYAAATALDTAVREAELNCKKTTITASPETKSTYWGLLIPADTPAGSYTGQNTITAKLGETANWQCIMNYEP